MMTCNWELRISVLSCGSVPTAVPEVDGICSIKAVTKNASTGATGKWMGLQYKNGNLTFGIDDDVTKSIWTFLLPSISMANGIMVCVRDGETKTLKMYINGVFQGEVTDKTGDISNRRCL